MKVRFRQISPQPLTGIVAMLLGGLVLVSAWRGDGSVTRVELPTFLAWVFLIGATITAAYFRIHLRNNTKLMLITLPLYLIAVVVPPPLAALGAGAAMFGVSLVLRQSTGNLPIDIMTTIGRWIVVGWLGSVVVHLPAESDLLRLVWLITGAVVMFVGDLVGTAFEVAGISGEPPTHLIRSLLRELFLPESAQYLVGIAGAIAAGQVLLALPLLALPAAIIYLAFKRAKEMHDNTRQLLETMADAIDLRDPYTGGHSRRVAGVCKEVLNTLAVQGPEAELILSAARVHDIGKIGVPDEILQKPETLDPEERRIIETHVHVGAELLKQYHDFARGKDIVLHHHERWDGTGYPSRLKGWAIPLGARVVAVADSFDAMTTDRPYRRAYSVEQALAILQEGRGIQWDPRIVDALVATRTVTAVQESSRINTHLDSLQAAS